ncbi:hypothetical protein BC940DRAFT_312229 [Gongronella butleri]|nr:hypothetical protein BC940DRAFT_312229 [Gongronella butleri]
MESYTCLVVCDQVDTSRLAKLTTRTVTFVDAAGKSVQQVLNEQRDAESKPRAYLLWDQVDALLLIDTSYTRCSARFDLGGAHSLDEAVSAWLRQPVSIVHEPVTQAQPAYALFLDIDTPHLHEKHAQWIDDAVQRCIAANHRLVVLLQVRSVRMSPGWAIATDTEWDQWQHLVAQIYLSQVKAAAVYNQPLFDMCVLFPALMDAQWMLNMEFDRVDASQKGMVTVDQWNATRVDQGLSPWTTERVTPDVVESDTADAKCEDDAVRHAVDTTVVGGTFDHLHAGHKILLTMTLLLATKDVIVGVTDDAILQAKKYKEWIEPTELRMSCVSRFCSAVRPDVHADIVPIFDPFGPTITVPNLDAIVVSEETLAGGAMVNDERAARGYKALQLRVIRVLSEQSLDDAITDKISSSGIRKYLSEQAK